MPPQPAPTPAIEPRQYVTVSSAMVVTATVDPNASYLPVDGQANSSAGASDTADYGTVTFEGVGGTLTADKLTTTSTETSEPTSTDSADADATADSAPKSQSISVGTVVAVAIVVGTLCLLLAFFFWWKRRKTKRENERRREKKRNMHQEMDKTYVGKVNPSNNFADDDDDYYDEYGADAKSTRSRVNPLSPPGGGLATFRGLNALGTAQHMDPGTHNSFLTFRSGELPPSRSPSESNIRESPTPVQTPKPRRVPTQKSLKGGGASQHGHAGYFDVPVPLPTDEAYDGVELKDRRKTKEVAMDNLLAALDTPTAPEHPGRSTASPSYRYTDDYDRDLSPVDPTAPHIIPSPSSPRASPHPFNNPRP
ncbi:hypothetical protein FRB90_002936 [Tulasnella sp. 427]|nr:hypothetical protein FRB90_002936 [Tulasnella sp. 427]